MPQSFAAVATDRFRADKEQVQRQKFRITTPPTATIFTNTSTKFRGTKIEGLHTTTRSMGKAPKQRHAAHKVAREGASVVMLTRMIAV